MASTSKVKTMEFLPVAQTRLGLNKRLRLGLSAFLLEEDAQDAFHVIKRFEAQHGPLDNIIRYQHWRQDKVLKIFFNVTSTRDGLYFQPPAIPGLPELTQTTCAFLQINKYGPPPLRNITSERRSAKLHEEESYFTCNHVLCTDLPLCLESDTALIQGRLSFRKEATTGQLKARWHIDNIVRRLQSVSSTLLTDRPRRVNLEAMRANNAQLGFTADQLLATAGRRR